MNAPGTIDKIIAFAESHCLTDVKVHEKIIAAQAECQTTFNQAVSQSRGAVCDSFSQLWKCLEGNGKLLCGAVFGDLMGTLMKLAKSAPGGLSKAATFIGVRDVDLSSCE